MEYTLAQKVRSVFTFFQDMMSLGGPPPKKETFVPAFSFAGVGTWGDVAPTRHPEDEARLVTGGGRIESAEDLMARLEALRPIV